VDTQQGQWPIYLDVIREARARGINFAIGGGFAVEHYTVHRQSTKDIDLYVLPEDRERMIAVVTDCGLKDYYTVESYDRKWIYRSHNGDTIVDVIWAMPNRRAEVDPLWLTRGPEVDLQGERVRMLPPEELIWAKLYVMQRDRCDWTDVINLMYATEDRLDWDHLLDRVGDDAPLLAAMLTIYRWLCPDRGTQLPVSIEKLSRPMPRRMGMLPREDLLDTRPWFIPVLEHAGQGR
jgi:predicted nucleotidyltransferase